MRKWIYFVASTACIILAAALILHAAMKEQLPQTTRILFVPKTTAHVEFWEVMRQGVDMAAQEFGAEVQVAGTQTEWDIEGQIRLLEQAIVDRPDAIILAATDYNRIVPVAKRIVEAGILLVTVDSGMKDGISSSFIATGNYEGGRKAGQLLADSLDKGREGPVAIINFVQGSATAMERERGVLEGLSAYKELEVLPTLYSNASEEQAYELTLELLKKEPALRGIAALNEPTVVGAARAIIHMQAVSQVKLIGFDNSMKEISYLEEGVLQATIVQKPFNMGYLAVKTVIDARSGRKVLPEIDTGSEVITKKNMYASDVQKLLFPFIEN